MKESFTLFYKRKIIASENVKTDLPHRFNSTKPTESSRQHSQTITRAIGGGNRKRLNFVPRSHGVPDGHPSVVNFLASKKTAKQINPLEAQELLKYYHIRSNFLTTESPLVALKRSGVSIKLQGERYWLILNKR